MSEKKKGKRLRRLSPATSKEVRGGVGTTPGCTPDAPPGKPNACWVQDILNGNAAAQAHAAVGRALS